jgi:hypothetical protein
MVSLGWRKFNSYIYKLPYYYNIFTDATTWDKSKINIDREEKPGNDWEKIMSQTYNEPYWYNAFNHKSTWEYPLKPCRHLRQYEIIDNDGRGDCLYKAFRDLINHYGIIPSYTHEELRKMACNWLSNDNYSNDAPNGTEEAGRLSILESLKYALVPPDGIEVALPEPLSEIKRTRKSFNKKYRLSEDTPIDDSISIGELAKRYVYVLENSGEYGNTPDIAALAWVLGVKTCVYKQNDGYDPSNISGSSFGPQYKEGPTFHILAYGDYHFVALINVFES